MDFLCVKEFFFLECICEKTFFKTEMFHVPLSASLKDQVWNLCFGILSYSKRTVASLQLIYLLKLKTETHKFDLHVGEIKDIPFNYVVLAFFLY